MAYLDTYSGNWSAEKARHLLRRTSFGITPDLVAESVTLGLSATVNKLFEETPLPEPPLKYELDGTGRNEVNDPDVNYGETWVNAPIYPDLPTSQERNRVFRSRNRSLYAWSFLNMQNSGISIREKLTLFWHNHFVSENTNPHREFYYMDILRKNALGNFKELTKQITIDPNMLIYLSGNENQNNAPNENYSRELLELFTIGKGATAGSGDYTYYTEEDVVKIAKVLTGWRARWIRHEDALNAYFTDNRHTKGAKTLSHRFNNTVIAENGDEEYKDVIDLIFQQEECSRFIVRQFYRWFVTAEISDDIETNIIEPLAKTIRDNDYEIAPALKVLLSSEHFYENTYCMIKSPIDLMLSATKSLLFSAPKTTIKLEYDFAYLLYLACTDLEQSIFHHPDVAGWKAYYQEPLFYKTWVNSYTLPKRLAFCKVIVTGGELLIDKRKYRVPPLVPVLLIATKITNAENPNALVTGLASQLFNYEISQDQVDSLKEFLIQGLPDFEWTVEYSDYLANPTDLALRASVENKLRNLIGTMVQMSEFQIM
ncbi:DUF1800 domain-containing protein [Polaribacter sp. WD7]|uniref:DUF1800 domain-containing protein n=1 Tax=Polaribacter sp. WD7 TaxID=2269061 RepID=UPI000DF37225|nr:DUF1800 domain-containing protein [Polaribacter sp. WD7]RCS26330.1 DUF1800 domain-containing protein [Polaribacter sp. WD7]